MSQKEKSIDATVELVYNSARTLAIVTVALPLLAELVAERRGEDKETFIQKAWDRVEDIENIFTSNRNKAIDKANNE